MAQPPEPTPLALQPSLDPALAQPRVQPDLDAPEHKHSGHEQAQQQQQQQQRQTSEGRHLQGIAQTSDTQTTDKGSACGPGGVVIEKAISDGVSTVSASSHNLASFAGPADPIHGGGGGSGSSGSSNNSIINHNHSAHHGARSDVPQNHGVPSLTLPAMSNTQPPPRPPRQPVAYPSPAPYAPASMPPISPYAYPPQAVPAPDPYRPPPTTLPSMRTLDHGQPPVQSQHALPLAGHMGAPLAPAHPAAPAPMAYYGLHAHAHMYGHGLPDHGPMRFALPPGIAHDPRIALSGGRHKKVPSRRDDPRADNCV